MSTSPFEIFRRNLKPLMVLLTLLALFAFVVLPALDGYLRRGGGINSDPVAAVYDGVTLTQSRVARTTQQHRAIVGFLADLGSETIRRGGVPQTPGFQYDRESGVVQAIGIDSDPSAEATINTMRFYSEAKKAGFELDDTAVKNWLSRYTDGMLSDDEIITMLMRTSNNQLGPIQLYEQLRMHLLADLYQRSSLVGLTNGQMPVVTPLGQWQNFLKTNQTATIDAYGVLVAEYIDKTDPKPSQAEINEVYEAGKDLLALPNDQSPEPKFRRPDSAKIEYVFADLNEFVEREKAKLSEEAIRAEYERRIAGGDFQLPVEETEAILEEMNAAEENAAEEAAEMEAEGNAATEADPATEKVNESTSGDETGDATTEMKTEDTKTDEPPATKEATQDDQPIDDKPAEAKPVTEETTLEAPKTDKPATDEPGAEDNAVRANPSSAMRLVAFQEDDETEDETKSETTGESGGTTDATAENAEAADGTPAETEPTSTEPVATAGDDEMDFGDAPAETKPQSFEDVRDEIATEMVAETARKKLDDTITKVNGLMRRYFSERSVHESNVEVKIATAEDAPKPLDLKAIAAENGMGYGTTEMVNRVSVTETPVGESYGLGQSLNRRGAPYYAMMFGAAMQDGSMIPPQPAYAPQRSVDLESAKSYISWKTEDIAAYTPELEEVRDEVILAIRTAKARDLAREEAEKMAASIAAGKTLAEIIPDDKNTNYYTGLGPFSWLDMVGMMQTTIGNVKELDSVGSEFMRVVFTTEVDQVGVAANSPQTVFYVVQPIQFQPEIEQLQEQFRQPDQRFMAMMLGNDEARNIVRGFYETINERTGFEMNLGNEQ